ncbi:hypothetical protein LCGC14_0406820 [marine sediment metagenome]|uniref:Uncharacterized protein n=1 Tax=marine sediment metagenome TaxID=412755 RepID=A0A0F9TD87_9ZZZZ
MNYNEVCFYCSFDPVGNHEWTCPSRIKNETTIQTIFFTINREYKNEL